MAARRVRKRSGRRVAADEVADSADDGALSAEEQSAPEDVPMEDADGTDGSGVEDDGDVEAEDDGKDEEEEEDEDGDDSDGGAEAEAPVARGHARRRSQPRRTRELRGERPKRKRHDKRFNVYIWRVLKQVHHHMGISKSGMEVMNSFVEDMFEQIMKEAQTLTQYQHKRTMSHREVTAAAKLVLFGDLATHAESEAHKALRLYLQSMQGAQPARHAGEGGRGKKKARAGKAPARRGERRDKR